jgi:hypothetical protein
MRLTRGAVKCRRSFEIGVCGAQTTVAVSFWLYNTCPLGTFGVRVRCGGIMSSGSELLQAIKNVQNSGFCVPY